MSLDNAQVSATPAPAANASSEGTTVSSDVKVSSESPVAGSTEGVAQGSAEPVKYVVNGKYVVKGQEKKFDDWVLPVIKDADTEKKVRELFEKAHGIDFVKDDRKQLQQSFQKVVQEHTTLSKRMERFEGYLANGDIATFQREAGIPNELILHRAKEILNAMENPALKNAEDQRYAESARVRELEEENETLHSSNTQISVQQRNFELNSSLVRPDIAPIVAAYDARAGRPGAFRDEIIMRGSFYQTVHKVDKSVEDLLAEIVPVLSGLQQQAVETPQIVPAQGMAPAGQQPPTAPVRKPVIPNVAGRGSASPVKKAVRSIQDIKDRAAELIARN